MGKLVLWLAVAGAVWLGWSIWRVARRRADAARAAHDEETRRADTSKAADSPATGGTRSGEPEPMVSCAHCRLYLPRREAVIDGNVVYCSTAHRDAGPRAGSEPR